MLLKHPRIILKYLVQVRILGQLDTMGLLLHYAPTCPTVQESALNSVGY